MSNILTACLDSLETGPFSSYRNLAVVPLLAGDKNAGDSGLEYLTLSQAMAENLLLVTEVGEGRVPELKVRNSASNPVLILDGEELKGAKQNRVLNSSILIAAGAELIVPVSCTEAGRWDFVSSQFADSKVVMHSRARSLKMASVSRELHADGSFASDQAGVWREIDALHAKVGSKSPTGAMSDAYSSLDDSLERYVEAIPHRNGQVGVVIFINDRIVGADVVSRPEAYRTLHRRLIRSYAMEALSRDRARGSSDRKRSDQQDVPSAEELSARARAFLAEASESETETFTSIGLGQDHRIKGARLLGSALAVDETVIHAALFRVDRHRDGAGRNTDEGMIQLYERMRNRNLRYSEPMEE